MNANPTFKDIVLDAFAPIMSKYGYFLVEFDDCYVRLDAQSGSIRLHYDRRRSFEVGVEFSQLESGDRFRQIPFNLTEVYRECGIPCAHAATFFQSTDITQVKSYLETVAEVLLNYCEPVLSGEPKFWEAVGRRRSVESAAYTRQLQLRSVRDEANRAWRDKKYQEFVNLLAEFRDILPASDRCKLEYAQKKLAGC